MLICRSYFKMKKVVLNVNYEYTISGVAGSCIELTDGVVVPLQLEQKHFMHNYCRSVIASRGAP